MKKESMNKVKLGIFVTLGIAIFVIGIYLIGQSKQLFSSTFRISALFKDVSGLQVGNNVRFAGINVGSVDGIQIITDSTVKVDMIIDVDVQKFIKKDSKAIIGTDGLMGNKIMHISAGTLGKAKIQDNDMIGTTIPINYDEILLKLKTTGENAAVITTDLAAIFGAISSGKGTIGRIFMDTVLAKDIDKTLINIKDGSEGFKLIMGDAQKITNDFTIISSNISSGQGAFGKILMDSAFAKDVTQITSAFSSISSNISSGQGAIGKILMDSVFAEDIAKTLVNVKEGTRSIKLLMDEAQNSWLLGSFWGGNTKEEDAREVREEEDKQMKEEEEELLEIEQKLNKKEEELLKEDNPDKFKVKKEKLMKERNKLLELRKLKTQKDELLKVKRLKDEK